MAIYDRILDKVTSEVKALNLSGILDANVKRCKVATDRQQDLPDLPGILISPTLRIRMTGGTIPRDDIEYPVLILMIRQGNQNNDIGSDPFLDWQEFIRRRFIHQHLDVTSACVYNCKIDPRDTYNIPKWLQNKEVGAIILRFVSREKRGWPVEA